MKCTHVLLKHTDIILGKHSSSLDSESNLCVDWQDATKLVGGSLVLTCHGDTHTLQEDAL